MAGPALVLGGLPPGAWPMCAQGSGRPRARAQRRLQRGQGPGDGIRLLMSPWLRPFPIRGVGSHNRVMGDGRRARTWFSGSGRQ